jgi:hypothetical protein
MEKAILDAIIQQKDVFSALHSAQRKLHWETQLVVRSAIERDGTKTREFISEISRNSWISIDNPPNFLYDVLTWLNHS